jgi:hypothetical protein
VQENFGTLYIGFLLRQKELEGRCRKCRWKWEIVVEFGNYNSINLRYYGNRQSKDRTDNESPTG